MKKNFVLDTNVLLHDSGSIYRFQENDIYLPIAVLEELDKFKKGAESPWKRELYSPSVVCWWKVVLVSKPISSTCVCCAVAATPNKAVVSKSAIRFMVFLSPCFFRTEVKGNHFSGQKCLSLPKRPPS